MLDVLVLGSGVAGLTTALHAARRGLSVLILTKGELSHSATRYAQGGVAAALADPDSPELHLNDTLNAGAGLCDVDAVRLLVTEGPDRVRELAALGAEFDGERSELLLAREGGHSLARVVHAGGDATGAEIERALVTAVRRSAIDVREGWFAIELLVEQGGCTGVLALDPDGALEFVRAIDVVLATGGAGQCFAVTTNPALSTGDGIALGVEGGRRVRRPRVRAIPSDRAAPRGDATAVALGSASGRGRGVARRRRRGVHVRPPSPRRPRSTRRGGVCHS